MKLSFQIIEGGQMEDEMENGLIVGHAYSITDVKKVNIFRCSI